MLQRASSDPESYSFSNLCRMSKVRSSVNLRRGYLICIISHASPASRRTGGHRCIYCEWCDLIRPKLGFNITLSAVLTAQGVQG